MFCDLFLILVTLEKLMNEIKSTNYKLDYMMQDISRLTIMVEAMNNAKKKESGEYVDEWSLLFPIASFDQLMSLEELLDIPDKYSSLVSLNCFPNWINNTVNVDGLYQDNRGFSSSRNNATIHVQDFGSQRGNNVQLVGKKRQTSLKELQVV